MEYVVGPVLALLISMKFTDYKSKQLQGKLDGIEAKIETVVARMDQNETEMPKRLMATVAPVAVAVKKLNEQVGI